MPNISTDIANRMHIYKYKYNKSDAVVQLERNTATTMKEFC